MSALTLLLAFTAGVLSILSPCVLPLLPMILGSAAAEHRYAPIGLAAGVGLSLALIGGLLASLGLAAGVNGAGIRMAAAIALIAIGTLLLVPALQTRLATAAGPVSNWANASFGGFARDGLIGQFLLGLLLGTVWTPCVGPTLGAASVLAARGENLGAVMLTMLAFGLGTGLALAALGLLSRAALMAWRDRLLSAGSFAKKLMGAALITVGVIVLFHFDKRIEGYLVDISPLWLTELTTRF